MSRLILDSHRVFLNKSLDLCVSQIFWLMQTNYNKVCHHLFFPWDIHGLSCYHHPQAAFKTCENLWLSLIWPQSILQLEIICNYSSYKFPLGCMLAEEISSLITYKNCQNNRSVVRIIPDSCEMLFINCFHEILQRWGNFTAIFNGKTQALGNAMCSRSSSRWRAELEIQAWFSKATHRILTLLT